MSGVEGEKTKSRGKPAKMTDAESVIEKHLEKAKRAREQEDKWLGVQNNLAVYVTGLPDDTSEAELAQVSHPQHHLSCSAVLLGDEEASACHRCRM